MVGVIRMNFIHKGWAIIAEQERILFHDSGNSGEKNVFYSYKENIHKISEGMPDIIVR